MQIAAPAWLSMLCLLSAAGAWRAAASELPAAGVRGLRTPRGVRHAARGAAQERARPRRETERGLAGQAGDGRVVVVRADALGVCLCVSPPVILCVLCINHGYGSSLDSTHLHRSSFMDHAEIFFIFAKKNMRFEAMYEK